MLQFPYFEGLEAEMRDLCTAEMRCSLCDQTGRCFELLQAICPELEDAGMPREGRVGCIACLQTSRFRFWHDTEIGLLLGGDPEPVYAHHRPPPVNFPRAAVDALYRTPPYPTWQQSPCLVHCCDFMTYLGNWKPLDFVTNAEDRDGRRLFLAMTDPEVSYLWDEAAADRNQIVPTDWYATYYAFRCRHCGQLRGNWDSP